MTDKYIVVVGNISDGFKFYGPYESFDAASESPPGAEPFSWIAPLENNLSDQPRLDTYMIEDE